MGGNLRWGGSAEAARGQTRIWRGAPGPGWKESVVQWLRVLDREGGYPGVGWGAAGLEGWQEAMPRAGRGPQEEPNPVASSSGKPRPSGTPQALVFLALVK